MEGKEPVEYWLSALFSFMQFFTMILFYDAFFERRLRKGLFWGIGLVFYFIGLCCVVMIHAQLNIIKIAGCVILFLLINFALYQGKFLMRVLTTLSGYSIIYLIGFVSDIGARAVSHLSLDEYRNDRALYVVAAMGSNLFLTALALWFRHLHKPRRVRRTGWAVLPLLFSLTSLMLLFPLYLIFCHAPEALSLLLVCVSALAGANIGTVLLVDWMEQSALAREQALTMRERFAAQEKSVEALSAAYTAQRKMTHDFRQHLSALSGMLSQADVPDAVRYIHALQRQQTGQSLLVHTHHAAIDAVLNQKAQYAQKRKIDIQFEVNNLSALRMRDIDCTVVLANLLDNAVEACMKLEPSERWIKARVLLEDSTSPDGGILSISVLNASLPVRIVDGRIATTKENPAGHGFGLLNVQEILAHYGAECAMQYQDGSFLFSMEWPNRSP